VHFVCPPAFRYELFLLVLRWVGFLLTVFRCFVPHATRSYGPMTWVRSSPVHRCRTWLLPRHCRPPGHVPSPSAPRCHRHPMSRCLSRRPSRSQSHLSRSLRWTSLYVSSAVARLCSRSRPASCRCQPTHSHHSASTASSLHPCRLLVV